MLCQYGKLSVNKASNFVSTLARKIAFWNNIANPFCGFAGQFHD